MSGFLESVNNSNRPLNRGMTDHDNQSVATILVYDSKPKTGFDASITAAVQGSEDFEVDSGSADGGIAKLDTIMGTGVEDFYGILNNFSVFSMSEQQKTIMKIQQHFNSDWNAFFMGSSPTMISVAGGLIDSPEYPYYEEFKRSYDEFLQGGKPIEHNLKVTFVIDGRIIGGYLTSFSTVASKDVPHMKQFTFTMVVRKSTWIRFNYINKRKRMGVSNKGRLVESNFMGIRDITNTKAAEARQGPTSGGAGMAIAASRRGR